MNKWQEKAIKSLVNKGYDELTASRLYEKAYKRLSPKVLSSGFNREFETYMSLVSDKNFIRFDIKNNRLYYVKTGEEVNTDTFERNYTTERLQNLADKYDEVYFWLESYNAGEMSLNELNERIKAFKIANVEYQKEGS
ncbi:MAG: hypothetical protein J6S85_15380 [Methanobrevibacter sp.]|nr:hypothetical protein [Methanobrevibacter sp.]